MIKFKNYRVDLIKKIVEKKSVKGSVTYWMQVESQLKRICKDYFYQLKSMGIQTILTNTCIKSDLLKTSRCLGITKGGGQCNRLVLRNNYCFQHNNQIKNIGCSLKQADNFLIKNQNKICLTDCIEGLKNLPSNSASIIICDPPYNIGKDFGNPSDKQSLKSYLKWCEIWIKECLRVLQCDGLLYIYGFSEILSYIQVTCLESKYVRWIIWHYTNKVSPLSKFWQRSHESILCCFKEKNPYFNVDLVREPYTKAYAKLGGKLRKNTKGRFGAKTTVYSVNSLGALPRDVLKVPALSGSFGNKERVAHPTQKPLMLCDKLIKSTLKKDNNLLVVPFVGSGSECVAAQRLKIPFIGFEINKDYISLANDRLQHFTK